MDTHNIHNKRKIRISPMMPAFLMHRQSKFSFVLYILNQFLHAAIIIGVVFHINFSSIIQSCM